MTEIKSQDVPFPNCPACSEQMTLVRSKTNGSEFKCLKHGFIVSVREALRGVMTKRIGSLLAAW